MLSFDANGMPLTSLQHVDYQYRPRKTASFYSLFEFSQTLRIQERKTATERNDATNPKNAGRPPSATMELEKGHPLRATHVCQIMAVHTVPDIIWRTPRYPGRRTNTAAWKAQARLFAYHILLVYRPWEGPDGIPAPETLTWRAMKEWLAELRKRDDIVSRTRLALVTIAAHGLRIPTAAAKIVSSYRFRAATIFDDMDEEDRPTACSGDGDKEDEIKRKAMHTAQEGEVAMNSLLHKASNLSNDKAIVMEAQTLKFLNEAFLSEPERPAANILPLNATKEQCYASLQINRFGEAAVDSVHAANTPSKDLPVEAPQTRKSQRGRQSRPTPTPKESPRPDFKWSPQQQAILNHFKDYLQKVAKWRQLDDYERTEDRLPPAPNMLITGGPGCGKSEVTRELTRLLNEFEISSLSSAMTGVAAVNMMNGATTHSVYGLKERGRKSQRQPSSSTNKELGPLSDAKKRILSSKIARSLQDGTPVVTIIDEVSMLTAITIGQILARYGEMKDFNAKFVQGPFILVGDFMQIEPVGGTPIFSTMMHPETQSKDMSLPEARGVALLKTLTVFHLDTQHRSQHKGHNANIRQLSTLDPNIFPFTAKLLACYPAITADEIRKDPLWLQAPIVVPKNDIRHSVNLSQIRAFARRQQLPVLFWRNDLCGKNAEILSPAEVEQLYSTHNALTSHFVPGVVSYLCYNRNTLRGQVNGARCIAHSLNLHPDEDKIRTEKGMPPLEDSIREARPGSLVQLALPPLAINVLFPDVDASKYSAADALAFQDGQPIVSMKLSPYSCTQPVQSWELIHRRTYPLKMVAYSNHGLDPGFSITYHKILGRTIDRLILDLNKYPNGKLTHAMVLVGLSRVRDLTHIRTMPMQKGQDQRHLLKLKANPEMLCWLNGYNTPNKTWSFELAQQALSKITGAPPPTHHKRPRPADVEPAPSSVASKKTCPPATAPRRPLTRTKLVASRTFTINSEGRISNMQALHKAFTSFDNLGNGDCLFESFKQSCPHITANYKEMRANMVRHIESIADPQIRVGHLNEHVFREADAGNRRYRKYRGIGLDEQHPLLTLHSHEFAQLWQQYCDEMKADAYAGQREAISLAEMYGVNLTIWIFNHRNDKAHHSLTHVLQPPAARTVHILSIDNIHFEATSLPQEVYPVICDLSGAAARSSRTRSQQKPDDDNSSSAKAISQIGLHTANPFLKRLATSIAAVHSVQKASSTLVSLEKEASSQNINDYCGMVLNTRELLEAIRKGPKIFELRTAKREDLPPFIVFHPNKAVQDGGYSLNIEAKVTLVQKTFSTASESF